MSKFSKALISASILAASLSSGTMADQSATSQYVDSVSLAFPGMAAKIQVRNTSVNKHVNNVNLGVQGSTVSFDIDGNVTCDNGINVRFVNAHAAFGNVSLNNGLLAPNSVAHSSQIDVSFWDKKNKIVENTQDTFVVPINKLKNAHQSIRVDAAAEINKKLQQHLQGGGTKLDFFRDDHTVVLQRPISVIGTCGKKNNPNKRSQGYYTKNHVIQVEYKGDKQLHEKAMLNAQLGNNVPNQFNNNPTDLPFKINDITFQPNMPHYIGKCAPNQNPKIRMNFNVGGDRTGEINLRIREIGNQYADYGLFYETTGIVNNPNNGGGHLDFYFPLKEMMANPKYSYMTAPQFVNKTFNHRLQIEAQFKDFQGDGEWGDYQTFDDVTFNHRCTAQLNPNLGNPGGNIGGYQQQPQGGLIVKPATMPSPKPSRAATASKVQMAPVTPKPTTPSRVQAAPVTPKPATPSRLQAAPKPATPSRVAPKTTVKPKPAVITPTAVKPARMPVDPTPVVPTSTLIKAAPAEPSKPARASTR